MNSIVRSNYPAAKLPEDLRYGVDPSATVTVTVTVEQRPAHVRSIEEIFAQRQPPFRTAEEIDAAVRRDRGAWDE